MPLSASENQYRVEKITPLDLFVGSFYPRNRHWLLGEHRNGPMALLTETCPQVTGLWTQVVRHWSAFKNTSSQAATAARDAPRPRKGSQRPPLSLLNALALFTWVLVALVAILSLIAPASYQQARPLQRQFCHLAFISCFLEFIITSLRTRRER